MIAVLIIKKKCLGIANANVREQQCCIKPVSLSEWVLRNFDLLQNVRVLSVFVR